MTWRPWSCPVDCSLPSTQVTEVASYGDISGPGVVAGFVASAGVTVLTVAITYVLSSDANSRGHHARKNLVDDAVLGSTRKIGRLLLSYSERLIPRRTSSWLAILFGQEKIKHAFSTSLLALSDFQIFTGLVILISGFVSLCPSEAGQDALPAYHWQILVHLAWFATITHQGTLFIMQKHFQEHRWQRNVRLALMGILLLLLIVAMLPTAFFNWYSKRELMELEGALKVDNVSVLVHYASLAKSAAQPVSPALCYFNVFTADRLFRSADPCRWGDINTMNPSWIPTRVLFRLREMILHGEANPSTTTNSYRHQVPAYSDETCDLHDNLFETTSFQAAILGMGSMAILSLWNAARLLGLPLPLLRARFRNPISRYSRAVIVNMAWWATRTLPTAGRKPDFAETVVTMPLLALHLTGRLILDMFTSKLAKVFLLIFSFGLGCVRLYPGHDPQLHIIQHEGWTFGQILAVLAPLSPLALVVQELLNGGSRAWHASNNQADGASRDRSIEMQVTNGQQEDDASRLSARVIRDANNQEQTSVYPDNATSTLDSLEYRSSKWLSIAVWFLVVTSTTLAYVVLLNIYMGWSNPKRLSTVLVAVLGTFPALCYTPILVGIMLWNRTSYYALGYYYDSRWRRWWFRSCGSSFVMAIYVFVSLENFALEILLIQRYLRHYRNASLLAWPRVKVQLVVYSPILGLLIGNFVDCAVRATWLWLRRRL